MEEDKIRDLSKQMSPPPGYRFIPNEEEIVDYLKEKNLHSLMHSDRIPDVNNLYNFNPPELAGMLKVRRHEKWHFFTKISKRYLNAQQCDRSPGCGFWKDTCSDKDIWDKKGVKIGTRKKLVYWEDGCTETDWIIKEYRMERRNMCPVFKEHATNMFEEWVLCKMYKMSSKLESKYEFAFEYDSESECEFEKQDHI